MLTTIAFVVGALSGIAVLTWLLSRWLQSEGARQTGSSGVADAFGNFIDVFDPARARADRDLKEHHNAGPVTKSPDDEDDQPVTLVPGPDGRPRSARIRRPRPTSRT